jgi:amidase
MPVGIKDLIETYDMPTEFGSDLFRGHQPTIDAACGRSASAARSWLARR